jgi:serine/threonine-protein kinase
VTYELVKKRRSPPPPEQDAPPSTRAEAPPAQEDEPIALKKAEAAPEDEPIALKKAEAAPEDEPISLKKPDADSTAPEQDPTPSKRAWAEGPASQDPSWNDGAQAQHPSDPTGIGFETTDGFRTGTAGFSLQSGDSGREEIPSIPPGTVLAQKYRVIRVLGRGGMGIVVEARHVTLETRVAIKVLRSEFVAHPQAAGRFLREARAASRLTGDHVAGVLDVGTLESGEPFMVMEFLAGGDLAYHAHAEGPLPILDAVEYMTQACAAIAAAHDLGIVHRDIKPANLFLTRNSEGAPLIKVLDFGVSKVIGESEGDLSLTQTTSILGSALYMSPEQMNSARSVDHRTDIYALGATLYELLGGEPPHVAKTFPELCVKVLTMPPRPLWELRPDIPEGLVKAIERALEREPGKRFASVAEFIQALSPYARGRTRVRMATLFRQFAPELQLLTPIRPGKKRSPWWTAMLCVAALAMGGFVAWLALGGHRTLGAWLHRGSSAQGGSSSPAAIQPPSLPPSLPSATPAISGTALADAAVEPDASATEQALDAATTLDAAAGTAADASTADATADNAGGGKDKKNQGPAKEKHFEFETEPGDSFLPSHGSNTTPAPPVNNDLSQETCYEQAPDGTRRRIPCN